MAIITVTGRYLGPDRVTPLRGRVVLTPRPSRLLAAGDRAQLAGRVVANVDSTGSISADMVRPGPDVQPGGWTVEVDEQLDGAPRAVYDIELPAAGATVDLFDLAPVQAPGGPYLRVPGPPGPAGADGTAGTRGDTGPAGPSGADGPAGPPGAPGATGGTGAPGPPGAQGEPGEPGPRGDTGPAGADGTPGAQGPTGPQGDPGPPGTDGAQGVQGAPGADGTPGATGAPGVTGERGPEGPAGEQGTAGATGATGPAGPAAPALPAGVFVPSGWGQHWRAARARAAAGTGVARIVTVGGSATQGMYASNPHTTSWPGVVRSALQQQYGDGGSGFFSSSMSATVLASGDAAALAAWQSVGAIMSQTGAWTLSGNRYGPGITGLYASAAGASCTFTVRGSIVRIFTVSGAGRPAFTYVIDGGAPVSVTQAAATGIQVTTVTGLTAGAHTVVLTAGAGEYLTVVGVSGENPAGVIVDNLARAGAGSASYATLPETAFNATWNGGVSYPCDLAIYTAGPNDASGDVAGDVWVANVAAWLRGVRDIGTAQGATDIILALPHLGRHTTANYRYAEYAARLRSLADSYGAAVVDWWQLGRNSWPYWQSLGYWGTGAGTGAAGTDSVHLSDAGFAAMAAPVTALLAS